MTDFERSILSNGALILATLLLIIGAAYVIRRYREEEVELRPDEPEDLMADFRAAYESGEMSEEEYRRVLETFERRNRSAGGAPPPAAPTPPAEPAPTATEEPGGGQEPGSEPISSPGAGGSPPAPG